MRSLLSVCLFALSLAVNSTHPVRARFVFELSFLAPQALQRGISVELAHTNNALPMPDADNERALVVTVTSDGTAYFGVDSVTPALLIDKLKASLANHQRKFYLKADAHAAYSSVIRLLQSALSAGIGMPVLLTGQPEPAKVGTLDPPKGLPVLVAAPADVGKIGSEKNASAKSSSQKVTVWVLDSPQHGPTVTLNGQSISWDELKDGLNQLLGSRSEKIVVVKADGSVPYAQVVHVIDLCQSVSAKVILVTPDV